MNKIGFRVGAGILSAVMLRLVLMPVSLHGDLFYIHSMPPVIFSEGVWNMFKYFGPFGAEHGYIHYPPLVGYITAFFEFINGMLFGSFHAFLIELPKLILTGNGMSSSAFFEQHSLSDRMLFAFLMKSPYLVFDLTCGLTVYFAYREEGESGWKLLFAWMFHPALLYGTYLFGQHRLFSTAFLWLAVFFLKKEKPAWACFAFGWILLLDNFGFIVFLPFVISASRNFKTLIQYALTALAPFALVFIPLYIDSGGYASYAYLAPQWLFQATKPVFPSIPYSTPVLKAVFAGTFGYILFLLIKNFRTDLSSEQRLKMIDYAWCATLFVFYAGTMVSVHYFLWVLPFFLLLKREGAPWPGYLNPVLIFLLFFFNLDSRSQNLGLFTPLYPEAASWPSLHELMAQWMPWGKIIGLSRMAFTILCLFMAWQLLDKRIKPLLQTAQNRHAL